MEQKSLRNWKDFIFKFNGHFYLSIQNKEYIIKDPKKIYVTQKRFINKAIKVAYNQMNEHLKEEPVNIIGLKYLGKDYVCELERDLVWLTTFSFYNPYDNFLEDK